MSGLLCCNGLQSGWSLSLDSYTVLYSGIKSGIVPLCKYSKALGKDWPWLQFGLKRLLHEKLQCLGHKERERLIPQLSFREAAARNRSTDLDLLKNACLALSVFPSRSVFQKPPSQAPTLPLSTVAPKFGVHSLKS